MHAASNRSILTTDDVNSALSLRNVEMSGTDRQHVASDYAFESEKVFNKLCHP